MREQWQVAARAQCHALVMIGILGVYDDAEQIGTADANAAAPGH